MAVDNTNIPTSNLPSDFSKANFYDKPPEEQEKLLSSLETAAQAVEQRYANPNWFNVAAGFLKPQLGGFMASLGSANQALGENLEKQRGSALTAAEYRARVALMRNQLEQKARANEALKQGIASPEGLTSKTAGTIQALGGTPPAEVAQALTANELAKRNEFRADRSANKTEAELRAKYGDQQYDLLSKDTPLSAPAIPGVSMAKPIASAAPEQPATPGQNAPAATPTAVTSNHEGVDDKTWNSMTADQKLAFTNKKTEQYQKDVSNAKEYTTGLGEDTQKTSGRYVALANAYPLFFDPGVKKAMSGMDKGTVESLIKQALAGQNVSGAISAIASRAVPADIEAKYPGTVAKVSTLMGIAAQENLAVNNSTQRPTLSTQGTEKTSIFNITDPAETAAKKVLLSLHEMQQKPKELAAISGLANSGMGLSKMFTDPSIKKLQSQYAREHKIIADTGAINPKLSSFFSYNAPEQAPSEPAPTGQAPASGGVEAALRANLNRKP